MSNLKEMFSCEGFWCLPEDNGNKIPGTLHYHFQDGIKLILKGSFQPFTKKDHQSLNFQIILGKLDHGQKITLCGCFYSGQDQRVKSFSVYNCLYAFTDHHFNSTEELKFKEISVNFSHLDEWLGISGFNVIDDYDKEKETSKILIEYIQPKPITIHLNEIFSISINFSYELPTGYYNQTEATIKQSVTVFIRSVEEKKISEFFEIIKQLEHFFSLGIMKPVCAFNFSGILNDESKNREKYPIPIEIYMALDRNLELRNKIHQETMLFSYNDILNKIEILLQNWFSKRESLYQVFDLYFTIAHNRDIPVYLEFLSYIQAIDIFQKRVKNSKANKIKPQLNAIFDDYKEFLFFFNIKKDQFIEDVVNTRNFLTHHNPKKEKTTLKGAGLNEATRKLRAILQLLLLLELGIERDKLSKFAGKIERWQLLNIHSISFEI